MGWQFWQPIVGQQFVAEMGELIEEVRPIEARLNNMTGRLGVEIIGGIDAGDLCRTSPWIDSSNCGLRVKNEIPNFGGWA